MTVDQAMHLIFRRQVPRSLQFGRAYLFAIVVVDNIVVENLLTSESHRALTDRYGGDR